jgi:hypothetical protein
MDDVVAGCLWVLIAGALYLAVVVGGLWLIASFVKRVWYHKEPV